MRPAPLGCRRDSGPSDECTKEISDLTLAPRRISKRHCIPVRPHLAMNSPLFPDIIHVKGYYRYNNTLEIPTKQATTEASCEEEAYVTTAGWRLTLETLQDEGGCHR